MIRSVAENSARLGSLRVEEFRVTDNRCPGDRAILAGIDLAIDPGERLAIMGESGAGKSTLLRTLAGVCPARLDVEGSALLDGRPIARDSKAVADERVAYVAGGFGARVQGTLRDYVRAGRPWVGPDSILRAIESAGLTVGPGAIPTLDCRPRPGRQSWSLGDENRLKLSLRVELARAAAGSPSLLLIDEALDGVGRSFLPGSPTYDAVARFIGNRDAAGIVVIATHSPSVALLCDRVIVLEAGQIRGEYRKEPLGVRRDSGPPVESEQ
jgi:ABC-type bacteriocin/lantibiotic exporter with double-glycine peptidase domain